MRIEEIVSANFDNFQSFFIRLNSFFSDEYVPDFDPDPRRFHLTFVRSHSLSDLKV